ncbi:MAG: cation:proton antiporter, partial [Candidatus Competibacteraceae bacterium]
MHEVFSEFALLLLISTAAGALAMWLRQPVLIAYILVGIIVGPAVLGLVQAHDEINLLPQVGVALLLFAVGLKLDLQHVRHIGPGPVARATGPIPLPYAIDQQPRA